MQCNLSWRKRLIKLISFQVLPENGMQKNVFPNSRKVFPKFWHSYSQRSFTIQDKNRDNQKVKSIIVSEVRVSSAFIAYSRQNPWNFLDMEDF